MNKFRKIAFYCLTFVFALSANAQTKVKAENPEEIELVSIVSHLALVNGYDWDAEDVGVDDYLAEFPEYEKSFKIFWVRPDDGARFV